MQGLRDEEDIELDRQEAMHSQISLSSVSPPTQSTEL
jgi:hypothetical protein